MSKSSKNSPAKQSRSPNTNNHSAPSAIQIQQTSFSGPLPLPAILDGYNQIVPGAAERIISMAEADAKHLREIEMAALQAAEKEVRRGQLFGFSLGLTALIASVLALYLGSETVASIIGGTTVVGLVSAFIIGRTKSLTNSRT